MKKQSRNVETKFVSMADDIYKIATDLYHNTDSIHRVYFIDRMKQIARFPESDREAIDYLAGVLGGLPWP